MNEFVDRLVTMNGTRVLHVEDLRWGPTFQPWLDLPTLKLDDAGKRAAARHIAEYRAGRARREHES